jgi:hypothetical protein
MPPAFTVLEMVLYLPDEVAQRRIGVEDLAAYAGRLSERCSSYFTPVARPEYLEVVVGLRPGGASKVWLVSPTRADPDLELAELRWQLTGVGPPQVREGPAAFAICASVAGGARPTAASGRATVPMPRAWSQVATSGTGMISIPDRLFEIVWPEVEPQPTRRHGPRLSELLPSFADELERLLRQEGREGLASQVAGLEVIDRCRCGDEFCATFTTAAVTKPYPPPPLQRRSRRRHGYDHPRRGRRTYRRDRGPLPRRRQGGATPGTALKALQRLYSPGTGAAQGSSV